MMAMTILGMAAAIEAALAVPAPSPAAFALKLATAIVPYIQNNAEVLPAGTPPLTCAAAPGPVAGKGVIQ